MVYSKESPEAPLPWEEIFSDVCAGDVNALEFCRHFVAWCHLIDDVADGELKAGLEAYVWLNLRMMEIFSANPFWQKHRGQLMPVIIASVRAWLDSEEWKRRDGLREQIVAEVIKSQYQDVIWQVAYLCGGWEHLQKVTAKWRDYHFDLK